MTSIYHEPPDGPPPLPPPGITIQVQAPPLLDPPQPPCLDDATRAQVTDAIKGLIAGQFPYALVASECVADPDAGDAAAFGVWPAGPQNPTPDQLDELLGNLRGLIGRQHGETIAFAFTGGFLNGQAQGQIGRYNGDGGADPNGPLHIQNVQVQMSPPDMVITKAAGFDERPFPDANFTLTVTEELTRGGDGQFNIQPKQSLDIDTTVQDLLDLAAIVFGGDAGLALGLYQTYKLHTVPTPDKAGAASALVASFLNPTIPTRGGKKLQVLYTRADAGPDGVRVGGVITGQVDRTPAVTVSVSGGETAIQFSQTQTVAHRLFGIIDLQDLLPPLSFSWQVDGRFAGDQSAVSVEFDAPAPGTAETQQVSLAVTDSDGLTASSAIIVQLSSPRDNHHGPGGSGNPLNEP